MIVNQSGKMKLIIVIVAVVCVVCSFASPFPKAAITCTADNCKIEDNCRCSSTVNPLNDNGQPPQLIAITVSESIVSTLYSTYLEPLFFERKNPDGSNINLTFFVNHEYTDYSLVQKLYLHGYEIASHSVTKNSSQAYWRNATLQDLIEEFGDQRQIIAQFANIPIEDIIGARTPQLQIKGDISIDAYQQAGLSYDNSWSTMSSQSIFPYTLDCLSSQDCIDTITCPTESHPGFWVAPLTNIRGAENIECNSLATCLIEGSADEIADWLFDEVQRVRGGNRAPLVLRLDSYWFEFTANSYEGFVQFLDRLNELEDTFLVSVEQVLRWVKNPVSYQNYTTDTVDRQATCISTNCELTNIQGQIRYMKSCVTCPKVYPWKGNPFGNITNYY